MEIEELIKTIIFAVTIVVVIAAIIFLFKGKGGDLLNQIRNTMRFG